MAEDSKTHWCHQCSARVAVTLGLEDVACASCAGPFVEELPPERRTSSNRARPSASSASDPSTFSAPTVRGSFGPGVALDAAANSRISVARNPAYYHSDGSLRDTPALGVAAAPTQSTGALSSNAGASDTAASASGGVAGTAERPSGDAAQATRAGAAARGSESIGLRDLLPSASAPASASTSAGRLSGRDYAFGRGGLRDNSEFEGYGFDEDSDEDDDDDDYDGRGYAPSPGGRSRHAAVFGGVRAGGGLGFGLGAGSISGGGGGSVSNLGGGGGSSRDPFVAALRLALRSVEDDVSRGGTGMDGLSALLMLSNLTRAGGGGGGGRGGGGGDHSGQAVTMGDYAFGDLSALAARLDEQSGGTTGGPSKRADPAAVASLPTFPAHGPAVPPGECPVCQDSLRQLAPVPGGDEASGPGAAAASGDGAQAGQPSAGTSPGASSTIVLLPCTHAYHLACVQPWWEQQNTCPVCRFELPAAEE